MTSWLSFVMSDREVVTFPLVSWVRCGVWLYRFLIFALFLTLNRMHNTIHVHIQAVYGRKKSRLQICNRSRS